MTTITAENLVKRYECGTIAVSDISFEIATNEFLVIVGPSGCGKSTLLRMIAGLEEITDGILKFDGKTMNNVSAKDRDVGMVFQNYALYPHLNVAENIAFPLKMRKEMPSSKINDRVKEVAEMLELTNYLNRKPKELSGGQRQRVALGRAIARKPRVFLFDEPLSNLDAKLRAQMRIEITRLQRTVGSTGIYVTHDQTEAMTIGDRIAVMRDGKMQQIGTPKEIYDNPTNEFVAGFIGSPSMNFIRGVIEMQSDILFVREEHGAKYALDALNCSFQKPPELGKPVTIGVRPENIILSNSDAAISVEIVAKEFLGHETLLYFRTHPKSATLCSRMMQGERQIHSDQKNISIELQSALIFDAHGNRL